MKRKKLTLLFIFLISTMLLFGCASTEITQTQNNTTIELGSECNLSITDFFELGSRVDEEDIILDTSLVDVNTLGDYEATVTHKKNTYKINVSVIDTTVPTITAKTDMKPVETGITIKASDYVEVTDLSGYTVYFVTDDGEKETLDIPSDFKDDALETTVIAVDTQDNRSNTVIIFIETDEEKAAIEEMGNGIVAPNSEDIHLIDDSEVPSDQVDFKHQADDALKAGLISQEDYDDFVEIMQGKHYEETTITPPAPSEPSAPNGGVIYDDPTQDPNYIPPDDGWVPESAEVNGHWCY